MSDDLITLLGGGRARGDRRCFAFIPAGGDVSSESITYEELVARGLQVSGGLRELGVGPGDRVALVARPDVNWVVTMVGTLFAGAVVAPVNHQFRHRELQAYLDIVRPKVVLTDQATDADVAAVHDGVRVAPSPAVVQSRTGGLAVTLDEIASADAAAPAQVDPADTAFLMHTSGTTGLPKAVVRSHETYARFSSMWADRYMAPDDDVLSFMPMYHQGGVMMSLLPTFLRGAVLHQLERFSATTFWSAARRYGTTWAIFMPPVPSFLRLHEDLDRAHPFRWAMTGGRVDHWAEMQDRFALAGHSGYGSTETTMVTMTGDRSAGPARDAELHGPLGGFACGRPIDGWGAVRVVRDDGAPAEPLEAGQLEFSGPGVITEYFGAAIPARQDDGWFRPGDIGYLDEDGRLFMIDRAHDLIRRSGENIAPREIEDLLLDHADVEEAAVVPVADELRGQELRACVVLRTGATTAPADLFRHCAQHVSAFKVPRYIEIRESLPYTPTMKIRKDVLSVEEPASTWFDRTSDPGSLGR